MKDGLASLLERLAQIGMSTPQPVWIRFLYCYPNRITQRLLNVIAQYPSLAKYIDMPLQHASASVLKRMKRGSSGDIFLKLLEKIRRTIPGVTIRTSMIVGFPGETDRDFDELCQFTEAAQLDRLGVFSFSDEETAASYALGGKVDARTIYNRKRHLMAVQRKISRKLNRRWVGQEIPVLIEGPSAESELLWEARSAGQAPGIDGVCYISDPGDSPLAQGQMRAMRITKAHDYDLVGDLVDEVVEPVMEPINPFKILPGGLVAGHAASGLPHR
jgi:ribosomal protein S12 methylthiotransferase